MMRMRWLMGFCVWLGGEGSKQFFFEKKKQKTFISPHLQQPAAHG